jgi:type VI secretion system protein ImpH
MAAERGNAAHSVAQGLAERPEAFGFFQAVRRLDAERPELPGTGRSLRPVDDPVRFGQKPSLCFAPRTLEGYEPATETHPARLYVNCFGLLGPNGPMPLYLTEYARSRQLQQGDPTLARFLDVFNHRLTALFYRAWAANSQVVSYERRERDRFAVYFASLFGAGMEPFLNRDAVPDGAKLYFTGHLAAHTRCAEGLCSILEQYFRVPTAIEPFIGQWLAVGDECRCRLGESRDTGTLGRTAVVGARAWECQHRFRIRMGPLSLADYERLLPTGESFRRLRAWVRNYVGDSLFWDLRLVLKRDEVPEVCLGRRGRLGWTTWVRSRPMGGDADDGVFSPEVCPPAFEKSGTR